MAHDKLFFLLPDKTPKPASVTSYLQKKKKGRRLLVCRCSICGSFTTVWEKVTQQVTAVCQRLAEGFQTTKRSPRHSCSFLSLEPLTVMGATNQTSIDPSLCSEFPFSIQRGKKYEGNIPSTVLEREKKKTLWVFACAHISYDLPLLWDIISLNTAGSLASSYLVWFTHIENSEDSPWRTVNAPHSVRQEKYYKHTLSFRCFNFLKLKFVFLQFLWPGAQAESWCSIAQSESCIWV